MQIRMKLMEFNFCTGSIIFSLQHKEMAENILTLIKTELFVCIEHFI